MTRSLLRLVARLAAATAFAAVAATASAQAPVLTVLRSLAATEGNFPTAGLVRHTDGALLGAAQQGGNGGAGTVFRVNPDGSGFAVLHHFSGGDGSYPMSELVRTPDGSYLGTTQFGGRFGYGVIYRIAADGSGFAVVRHLQYQDGTYPVAGLTDGGDGWFYGAGRAGGDGLTNSGTVFRMRPDGGDYTVLHAFSDGDGRDPYGTLLVGRDGALYGTTFGGGGSGLGTVFRIARDGSGFATLRHFGGTSGERPTSGLVQGADGALFGVVSAGGSGGRGAVYRLNPDGGGFAVAHAFSGGDGQSPFGRLLVRGGSLYGTTFLGGTGGGGTIFKLRADGSDFSTVWNFGWGEPGFIFAGLTAGDDGRLYGAAASGVFPATGAVFALSDLQPPEITSALAATGAAGAPFTYAITATNEPDDFDALGLPAELAVDAATGVVSGTPAAAGVFPVTIGASNAAGTGVATLVLTFEDRTAPQFVSLTASHRELWPANHQMVAVRLSAVVRDAVDAAPSVRIVRVTSNEPVDGQGDGSTGPDWEITGALTVNLRAERAGGGGGRVYTITVAATDASGNTAERVVTVTVPKSRGRG